MKKVKLQEIADEISMLCDDTTIYYNVDTGELMPWYSNYFGDNTEFWGDVDEPEMYEEIHQVTLIPLPEKYEVNDYRIMEDFIDEIDSEKHSRILSSAIRGRGAFRKFRDRLEDLDIEDQWYAFEENAYRKIAREWCEDNQLEYE